MLHATLPSSGRSTLDDLFRTIGLQLRRCLPSRTRRSLQRLAAKLPAAGDESSSIGLRTRLGKALAAVSSVPIGGVRFGDLRRTTPISSDFGYGRGGPVDRYYIESFLDRHRRDIRGRVLEIGDSSYTRRFGGASVVRADVLHVDPAAGATFTGDLSDPSVLPADTFDCIILTQTLHLVFDFLGALRTVERALAPGGVLLMTVPGISNVDCGEWGSTWCYSFTEHSVRRMLRETFDGCDAEIRSHGNVLAAVAFLHGLGSGELSQAERDEHHVEYSLIHTARVAKASDHNVEG